ncbi:hypothetical protein ACFY0R_40200 [Streptomyces sp. NPDC001633]|uniref:hypothetical protein n=1 Tax=Streptomyces sp. NPDC001633 TaxID=3364595 RepID=UPI00368BA088
MSKAGGRPPRLPRRSRLQIWSARSGMVVALPDRAQLGEIVLRVRDGRLRTNIDHVVATLDDAFAALNPTERRKGKPIIRVRP